VRNLSAVYFALLELTVHYFDYQGDALRSRLPPGYFISRLWRCVRRNQLCLQKLTEGRLKLQPSVKVQWACSIPAGC